MIEIYDVEIKITASGIGYISDNEFQVDIKFLREQLFASLMGWC